MAAGAQKRFFLTNWELGTLNYVYEHQNFSQFLDVASILLFHRNNLLRCRGATGNSQSGSSFSMRVDVDLVTVEVTALDKNGKPAHNLKKENFRLYEDGKKQEILSFDEVKEGSEAPISILADNAPRGKTVLIVFDDCRIAPANIKRSRDSAAKFVIGSMGPEDLFAVARFDGSMNILQNFTSDRAKVLAAIGQPATSNQMGFVFSLLASLDNITYSLAHMKGQKSVLIYFQSESAPKSASLPVRSR